MPCTLGMDFGTAHNSACIATSQEIIHCDVFSMPKDFGSTKKVSATRRSIKRRSHRKIVERAFWKKIDEAGLPVLKRYNKDGKLLSVDKRLTKEFAKKGDDTVYSSCLLRVMILEGRISELEPWQMSKALYSLLKRRGYDANLPWARALALTKDDEEETKTVREAIELQEQDMNNCKLAAHQLLPAYREAMKSNLFNPETNTIRTHQGHDSQPFKLSLNPKKENGLKEAYFTDRKARITEATKILSAVAELYPNLNPTKLMFGKYGIPYGPFSKGVPHGRDSDLEGIFSTKIPRFHNRKPDKCTLMSTRNTTRKNKHIFRKFTYYTQIRNLRAIDSENNKRPMNYSEFMEFLQYADQIYKKSNKPYKITKRQIGNIFAKLGLKAAADIEAVEPASAAGRARYCTPALAHLVEFYLSGKSPDKAYREFIGRPCSKGSQTTVAENSDPGKGLTLADFEWLAFHTTCSWEEFYLKPMDQVVVSDDHEENLAQIYAIISGVRDPVVRHRLQSYFNRLQYLNQIAKNKVPTGIDRVSIELCRDSFSSKKSKARYRKITAKNRADNDEAKRDYEETFKESAPARKKNKALELIRLLKKQKMADIYTGDKLRIADISNLDIDHIVPRSRGGNDSRINKVVTSRTFNNAIKGSKTPHEYFCSRPKHEYIEFRERVNDSNLSEKTKQLLTSPTATEDLQQFTDLSRTAHIAKKIQHITYLFFGWKHPEQGGKKKIFFFSGGHIASIRRQNGINFLLYDKYDPERKDKKNRNDLRNHALDAMVISQAPDLDRHPSSDAYKHARRMLRSDHLKEVIYQKVIPVTKQNFKSELEENFYGINGPFYTKKHKIEDLASKTVMNKVVFSIPVLKSRIRKLIIQTQSQTFERLADCYEHDETSGFQIPLKTSLTDDLIRVIEWYNQHCTIDKDSSEQFKPQWTRLCETLRQKKVLLAEAETTDPRFKKVTNPQGAVMGIKGKGSHKGYAIVRDEQGKLTSIPHYIFESTADFYKRCPNRLTVLQSGDLVRYTRKKDTSTEIWRLSTLRKPKGRKDSLELISVKNPKIVRQIQLSTIQTISKVDMHELPYPPYP